jgi:CRISPR-associated protein Cas1
MQVLEINRSGISLSIYKGFIRVSDEDFTQDHPLDLVDCIILNSYGAKVSNRLMIKLCELNIPMLICANNSIPIGILSAVAQNVNRKSRIEAQLCASKAFLNRQWQAIVKAKIHNQMLLLKYIGAPYQELRWLKERVSSGDKENREAQAARLYWSKLFGRHFRRNPDIDGINSYLNYAYAIIRAGFCRQIMARGLLPEIGIHHRNQMNPFCLADDLMEPFRPFADKIVYEMNLKGLADLCPKDKKTIISTLDSMIPYSDKKYHLQTCIALYVQDMVSSYEKKKNELKFPILPPQWLQTDVDDGNV